MLEVINLSVFGPLGASHILFSLLFSVFCLLTSYMITVENHLNFGRFNKNRLVFFFLLWPEIILSLL